MSADEYKRLLLGEEELPEWFCEIENAIALVEVRPDVILQGEQDAGSS